MYPLIRLEVHQVTYKYPEINRKLLTNQKESLASPNMPQSNPKVPQSNLNTPHKYPRVSLTYPYVPQKYPRVTLTYPYKPPKYPSVIARLQNLASDPLLTPYFKKGESGGSETITNRFLVKFQSRNNHLH